jgi:hypothetical protein
MNKTAWAKLNGVPTNITDLRKVMVNRTPISVSSPNSFGMYEENITFIELNIKYINDIVTFDGYCALHELTCFNMLKIEYQSKLSNSLFKWAECQFTAEDSDAEFLREAKLNLNLDNPSEVTLQELIDFQKFLPSSDCKFYGHKAVFSALSVLFKCSDDSKALAVIGRHRRIMHHIYVDYEYYNFNAYESTINKYNL